MTVTCDETEPCGSSVMFFDDLGRTLYITYSESLTDEEYPVEIILEDSEGS